MKYRWHFFNYSIVEAVQHAAVWDWVGRVQRRRGALRPDTLQPITLPLTAPLLERLYPGLVWGQAQYFIPQCGSATLIRTRSDPYLFARFASASRACRCIRDRIQPVFFLNSCIFLHFKLSNMFFLQKASKPVNNLQKSCCSPNDRYGMSLLRWHHMEEILL